jgi:hypothetical protein
MDSTAAMAAVVSKAGAAGRRGAGADDADRQIQTCAHRRGYPEQRKAPMNGICNGDWMRLRCGDRVHTRDDPRHIGRVEAIHHGAYARVRWDETWRSSEVPIGDLVNLSR